MTSPPIPPRLLADAQRALAKRQDSGEAHYVLCRACGTSIWVSSDMNKPACAVVDGWLELSDFHGLRCERCDSFNRLHPEVSDYLLRVLAFNNYVQQGGPPE